MNAIDIEKLNQLISRTDISGNDKVKWLTDFIDGKEFEQQERSYSKEEVLNLLIECSKWQLPQTNEDLVKIKQWFEQIKKK